MDKKALLHLNVCAKWVHAQHCSLLRAWNLPQAEGTLTSPITLGAASLTGFPRPQVCHNWWRGISSTGRGLWELTPGPNFSP